MPENVIFAQARNPHYAGHICCPSSGVSTGVGEDLGRPSGARGAMYHGNTWLIDSYELRGISAMPRIGPNLLSSGKWQPSQVLQASYRGRGEAGGRELLTVEG